MLTRLLNRWRREDVSLPEAWRRIAHAEVIRPEPARDWRKNPIVVWPERIAVRALVIPTTTHRVADIDGIVHCVPAPGEYGCVLRWQPRDAKEPVQF
jgi:hypothetical protein